VTTLSLSLTSSLSPSSFSSLLCSDNNIDDGDDSLLRRVSIHTASPDRRVPYGTACLQPVELPPIPTRLSPTSSQRALLHIRATCRCHPNPPS
jgi:hypothetical protein